KLPVPKVYAWSSRATENPVGAEYIVMEKVGGVELSKKWPSMSVDSQQKTIETVIDFEKAFASMSFSSLGSLYYTTDITKEQAAKGFLYVDGQGEKINCHRFAIGPTTERNFFDDGRGTAEFDRGPYKIQSSE